MAASITFNGTDLINKINILQYRQIPWITALTLSGKHKDDVSLATPVKKDLLDEMKVSFRQVSPETQKLFHTKATKKSLKTVVSHKEDAAKGNSLCLRISIL